MTDARWPTGAQTSRRPVPRRLRFASACVIALCSAQAAQAPSLPLLALLDENQRSVAVVDPTTGASRRVYNVPSPKWAWNLTVAPDQQRLAIIERERTSGPDASPSYRSELVVLDATGKVVRRVPRDVQRYVWCGATCLAYIEGSYREGGLEFVPSGVAFVLELATGDERPLPGPTYPYGIRWAGFDSSLYLKNAGREDGFAIFRYHLPTGTLTRTSYLDFDFSPSGRYYVHWAGEANDRTTLLDRASNREVALPDPVSVGTPARWLFAEGDYLLLVRHERLDPSSTRPPRAMEKVVFDVSSRRVIRRIEGDIQPWSAAPGVLPVVRGGRINLLWRPRQ